MTALKQKHQHFHLQAFDALHHLDTHSFFQVFSLSQMTLIRN